jgi:hypothetical protein
VDPEHVSRATFVPQIGTEFRLVGDEQPLSALVLDGVELLPAQPRARVYLEQEVALGR